MPPGQTLNVAIPHQNSRTPGPCYSCRADKRGDDPGCSTFSEVGYKCALHKNVQCNDLEGKFLGCYKGGRGGSANECAFGVNMLVHCRDSANKKVFEDKNTCNNTWKTFSKECQGSNGLSGANCTKGESWQDVSYAICEKRKQGHMCVTYISPQDGLDIDKGGDLPLVFVTAGLDVCAAVLGAAQPVVAGGCGIAKAMIDVINGVIEEIEQSAISAALNGSREHGESGGIQVITLTSNCRNRAECRPQYEHVIRKDYAPL